MGSIPPELSLDYRHALASAATDVARHENSFPKTITKFIAEVSMMSHVSEKFSKLDDYVKRLEDEMRKIDAFKRELPLCMLLLSDAIIALKEETSKSNVKPILEEFIPLKKNSDEDEIDREETRKVDFVDKKNWMSSVQLWNSSDNQSSKADFSSEQISKPDNKKRVLEEEDQPISEDFFKSCKSHRLRAFAPLKGSGLPLILPIKEDSEKLPMVPVLSLQTHGIKKLKEDVGCVGFSSTVSGNRVVSSSINSAQRAVTLSQSQTARKQRRCWSPELHRRFVDALQKLGGCQAATPKQIRDLMQVDGLTNDEVKSHLQKYRLHTRRIPASTNTPCSNQSVVLGGLWMTQEQCGESSKQSTSQSSSPQSHLQLGGVSVGTSMTGGDSMEEEQEDEKSESHSWKSHAHTSKRNDV